MSQELYHTESGETLFNEKPRNTFHELSLTDREQARETNEATIKAARNNLSQGNQ